MSQKLTLRIDNFPTTEEALTTDQRREVRTLCRQMQGRAESIGAEKAFHEMKLLLFLAFAKLEVTKKTATAEDGNTVYFLRRKGLLHFFERIPITSMQMTGLIQSSLGWLDLPTAERIASER